MGFNEATSLDNGSARRWNHKPKGAEFVVGDRTHSIAASCDAGPILRQHYSSAVQLLMRPVNTAVCEHSVRPQVQLPPRSSTDGHCVPAAKINDVVRPTIQTGVAISSSPVETSRQANEGESLDVRRRKLNSWLETVYVEAGQPAGRPLA
jgi:hypothetical protein